MWQSSSPRFPYPTALCLGALSNKISCFVISCVSSDNSFLSQLLGPRRDPLSCNSSTSFPGAQSAIFLLSTWTPFRVCCRSTVASAQDSVPAEADGKCPWQVPVCSWQGSRVGRRLSFSSQEPLQRAGWVFSQSSSSLPPRQVSAL